jgi:hypothetical protein
MLLANLRTAGRIWFYLEHRILGNLSLVVISYGVCFAQPTAGKVPETIVWRHKQGGTGGRMYHRGRFYLINEIDKFVSDGYAHILLDSKDAWLILDGEPPHDNRLCKCLVISSPGNLHQNFTHVKQYHKNSSLFRVYLPTWTVEELWEVSRVIQGSDADKLDDIVDRFEMFGGIARYVLQEGYGVGSTELLDPIKDALNIKSVLKVVNEVETEDVDQTKTSGVLIHLIPAEGYRSMRYELGSFYIMEKAFNEVFKVEKDTEEYILFRTSSSNLMKPNQMMSFQFFTP